MRDKQEFILLEGANLCDKLSQVDSKLQLRYMDELFLIEKHFGEV